MARRSVAVLALFVLCFAVPAVRADDPPYYIPADTPVAAFYGIDERDGAALYDVWVPVTGNGSTDGPWRPDVEVRWRIWGPGPCGTHEEILAGQTCTINGHLSSFFSPYCCIVVTRQDIDCIENAIPLHEVCDHDKLLLRMDRCIDRDDRAMLTLESINAIQRIFSDERERARTDEGYQLLTTLLYRMHWRGLPYARYQRVATMLAREHAAGQPA